LSKTQKLPQYQIVFKFNLKMVQGGWVIKLIWIKYFY
jgi:hypothetical protein